MKRELILNMAYRQSDQSEKTPNLCHLAPAGPTYMEDLNEAGGVYAVMNELAGHRTAAHGVHDRDRKDRRGEYCGCSE